jgi:hypothetical protein
VDRRIVKSGRWNQRVLRLLTNVTPNQVERVLSDKGCGSKVKVCRRCGFEGAPVILRDMCQVLDKSECIEVNTTQKLGLMGSWAHGLMDSRQGVEYWDLLLHIES